MLTINGNNSFNSNKNLLNHNKNIIIVNSVEYIYIYRK